jgi:hypothetical protein
LERAWHIAGSFLPEIIEIMHMVHAKTETLTVLSPAFSI